MKLATAWVEVRSKDAGAKVDARKIVDQIGKETAEIGVTLDDGQVQAEAKALVASVTATASKAEAEVPVGVDDQTAAPVSTIRGRLQGLSSEDQEIVIRAAVKQAQDQIAAIDRQLANLDNEEEIAILVQTRDEATKKLEAIQSELKETEKVGVKAGDSIARKFVTLFSAAVFVNETRKAIDAASQLEQQVGGTEAVFKEASDTIDAYAENAAEKVGLSERAFREATTSIGGSLKRMGLDIDASADQSIRLVEIAGDLAATYGGTTAEAVGALGAAFRGEFDSAERFNLGLTAAKVEAKAVELGLADAKGKIDDYGKAQATIALIVEQSADAQGQFGREADTAAGRAQVLSAQLEDMRASLGANFLPVFSRVVSMLTTASEIFGDLPGPVQVAIVALAGITIVASPLKRVIESVKDLRTSVLNMGTTAQRASGVFIGAMVAMAAVEIFDKITKDADASNKAMDTFLATVGEQSDDAGERLFEFGRIADETFKNSSSWSQAGSIIGSGLSEAEINARSLNDAFEAVLAQSPQVAQQVVDDMLTLSEAVNAGNQEAQEYADYWGINAEVVRGWQNRVDDATGAQETLTGATQDSTGAVEQLGDATKVTRDAIAQTGTYAKILADDQLAALEGSADDAATAAEDLASALDEVFGGAVDLQGAADTLQANIDDLAQSLKDNGKTLDDNTEKGRANREQLRTNVAGIQDYIRKLIESGATTDQVGREYELLRADLVNQATQFGLTEDQANQYINQLGLTPDSVTTAVNLANVEPAREAIRRHIERVGAIPTGWQTIINAHADAGDLAAVERQLEHLRRQRIAVIRIQTTGGVTSNPGTDRAIAEGGFFRGGSVVGTSFSLAEIPGRRGDEVVFPLGNLPRMKELLASPEVGPRVAAALGDDGSSGGGGSVAVVGASGGDRIQIYVYGAEERYVNDLYNRLATMDRRRR